MVGKFNRKLIVLIALMLLLICSMPPGFMKIDNTVYASGSRIITFPESTNRSQSQTITLQNLQSIINATVDTGSVSYSVNGDNVTINVSNGNPTRVTSPSMTQTDYRTSSTNSFPDSIPYNNGGYSGTLYKSGSSYVISGTPADSKSVTVYSPTNTVTSAGWTNPWVTTSESSSYSPPSTWSYSDGSGYSGSLPRTGTNTLTSNPDHGVYHYGAPVGGRTPWTCHRYYQAIYSGTVTKPDTRVWRQNYSGTVYGTPTNYYSYNVTLTYSLYPPTVAITSPSDGAKYIVGSVITISASGTHCDHMAACVNGTWIGEQTGNSYSNTYTLSSAGSYTIRVDGRNTPTSSDPDSQAVTTSITISAVTANTPVTVSLNAPTNGSTYTIGSSIPIIGTGTNCHHIAAFANGSWIATQNGNNFSYNYTPTAAGSYSIYIAGRNTEEGVIGSTRADSSPVTVNVVGPTPTPSPTATPTPAPTSTLANTPTPSSIPTPTALTVEITYPGVENGSYNKGNVPVTWSDISGASYEISMRDTTVNMLVLSNIDNGTSNSYTILSKYLYEGHSYRIAVKTTIGTTVIWAERNFNINLSSARNTIISRGSTMIGYSWIAAYNVRGWRNLYTFDQGTLNNGIAYSQTEFQCSISSVNWVDNRYFDLKKDDAQSGFYDDYTRTLNDETIIMPKYGNDCSGYVSICWNITRNTTATIVDFPRVGKPSESFIEQFARMSPGDAFVRSVNGHTFIIKEITAINDANGNLVKLKFVCNEQTPYWCRVRTWYSDGCEDGGYIGVCKNTDLAQDYSWNWQ